MNCPQCRRESPPSAKFCPECGAQLLRTCAQCGGELPLFAKFCPACGAVVGGRATALPDTDRPSIDTPRYLAEKILASKAALEGERKQVTVLFADMKGSTQLIADRDPEEARTLLAPVLERMMEGRAAARRRRDDGRRAVRARRARGHRGRRRRLHLAPALQAARLAGDRGWGRPVRHPGDRLPPTARWRWRAAGPPAGSSGRAPRPS